MLKLHHRVKKIIWLYCLGFIILQGGLQEVWLAQTSTQQGRQCPAREANRTHGGDKMVKKTTTSTSTCAVISQSSCFEKHEFYLIFLPKLNLIAC